MYRFETHMQRQHDNKNRIAHQRGTKVSGNIFHVCMQVDPSIYRQYCAAFCGLYYTCKKNNKVGGGLAEQLSQASGIRGSTQATTLLYNGAQVWLHAMPVPHSA